MTTDWLKEGKKVIGIALGVGVATGVTLTVLWLVNYAHSAAQNPGLMKHTG